MNDAHYSLLSLDTDYKGFDDDTQYKLTFFIYISDFYQCF